MHYQILYILYVLKYHTYYSDIIYNLFFNLNQLCVGFGWETTVIKSKIWLKHLQSLMSKESFCISTFYNHVEFKTLFVKKKMKIINIFWTDLKVLALFFFRLIYF